MLITVSFISGLFQSTPRTGWVRCGIKNPESIADHMYRMATMAFLVNPCSGLAKDRYMIFFTVLAFFAQKSLVTTKNYLHFWKLKHVPQGLWMQNICDCKKQERTLHTIA